MELFTGEYLVHHGLQDDYLMHYGVPGMKWGVRRSQRYTERANKQMRYAKNAGEWERTFSKSANNPEYKQKLDRRKKILKRAAIAAGVGAAAVGTTIAIRKGYGKYANRLTNSSRELATLSPSTRARGGARRRMASAARNAANAARREASIRGSRVKLRAGNAAYRARSAADRATSAARRQGVIARGRTRTAAYNVRSAARRATSGLRRQPSSSRELALLTPSTRVRGSRRRAAASAARRAARATYSGARSGARRARNAAGQVVWDARKAAGVRRNLNQHYGGKHRYTRRGWVQR